MVKWNYVLRPTLSQTLEALAKPRKRQESGFRKLGFRLGLHPEP